MDDAQTKRNAVSVAPAGDEDSYQEIHLYEGDSALVIRKHGNKTLYGVQLPELLAHFERAAPAGDEVVAAWDRVIDGKAVTISLEKTAANDEPLYSASALSSSKAEIAELRAKLKAAEDSLEYHLKLLNRSANARYAAEQALEAAAAERDAAKADADEWSKVIIGVMSDNPGIDWRDYPDGITAAEAGSFFNEDMAEAWRNVETAAAEKRVLLGALLSENDATAEYLRYCASHYPEASDGRNTFIMAASWVEARRAALAAGEPRT